MLRIINPEIELPLKYPIPERVSPTMTDKGSVIIDGFQLRDNIDLIPQEGLQEAVLSCECNLIFMAGSATMGKALPVNELVLTMHGWIPIGTLMVGDKIMDVHGHEQTVDGVYPQGKLETYEFEMKDGGKCEASGDHLWEVYFKNRCTKGHWTLMDSTDLRIHTIIDHSVELYLPTYLHYRDKKRRIKSITHTHEEKECVCIKVSSKEELFITRDYIVTHNTFAGFMKALQGLGRQNYTARLISKRLQDSKKGGSIIRDAKLIYDGFAGCDFTSGEYPTAYWSTWNSSIQLIHANFNTENPSEWEEYKDYCKKNQASYIYWDELTEIRDFKAFSYMFSRNRDSSSKPCTVCSFNSEHDHWSTKFLQLAGYIGDDWYAIPEKYGSIVYFAIKGDTIEDIVFGETREEVVRKAEIEVTKEEAAFGMTAEDMVKSFTFLSGSAMSNKILVNATGGGSVANLYNVGETERRKIKDAYFGPSNNNTLTVSKQMILNLWQNAVDQSNDMYATMDVSSGKEKADNCAMWIWKGHTAIALERFEGNMMELVTWIHDTLSRYNIPMRHFAFDATAIGYYLKSFTDGIPIIGNARPIAEYDTAGNQISLGAYFNLRTQLMAKMKVLLETGVISCLVDKNAMFPHGKHKDMARLLDILLEEINVFLLGKKNNKQYYHSKDEYISRFKSSPDYMDAFIYRAVFDLDMRPRKEVAQEYSESDYAELYLGW